MAQQDLHEAEVNALFQESGRKAVAKGVGRERVREAARRACPVEGQAGGVTGQMEGAVAVGEEPLGIAMGLPDLAKHAEGGLGQGQGALLVAFADHPQEHLLGIDGGDGQFDGFAEPQAAGVDQGETAAADRLADRGDQAAAVLVASNVGKALAIGLADFFFVSRGQSQARVLTKRNLMAKKCCWNVPLAKARTSRRWMR